MLRGLALLLLLLPAPGALAAETMRTEAAHLRFNVPRTWTRVPATADTEGARFRLPAATGDLADTEFVLRTGADARPTADDQLARWYGRFTQPDGRPSSAAAAVFRQTVDGLRITRVDLTGTYVGSAPGAVEVGVSGYRLLGAFLEGDGGPWTLEILGPQATVGDARADFDALLFTVELHP
jgi:hypothetical protein